MALCQTLRWNIEVGWQNRVWTTHERCTLLFQVFHSARNFQTRSSLLLQHSHSFTFILHIFWPQNTFKMMKCFDAVLCTKILYIHIFQCKIHKAIWNTVKNKAFFVLCILTSKLDKTLFPNAHIENLRSSEITSILNACFVLTTSGPHYVNLSKVIRLFAFSYMPLIHKYKDN